MRRSDDELSRLIDRIRALVAERRRLAGGADSERQEANRREIARQQRRLAIAVRRELSRSGGQSTARRLVT